MQKESHLRQVIRDLVVLALILLAANYVIHRDQPGWTILNPSPYLVIPVLLGGRYGFKAGVIGAVGACLCIFIAEMTFGDRNFKYLIEDQYFLLVSTLIAAAISGALHSFLGSKRDGIETENAELSAQCAELKRSLEVSREAQHLLQQNLALQGAEVCSFDLELRRLFDPEAGPILPATLELLNRFSGVSDAAFYTVDAKSGKLTQEARMGSKSALPDVLNLHEVAIANAALDADKMITCKEIWKDTPDLRNTYIAALPWKNEEDTTVRLLLIHRMPFNSVNWQNFARIQLVCDWVSSIDGVTTGCAADRVALEIKEKKFDQFVEKAVDTAAKNSLPSTVIIFTAAVLGSMSAGELRSLITPHLRSSDLFTVGEGTSPRLSVLLPMEGERDASLLTEKVLKSIPDAEKALSLQKIILSNADSIAELKSMHS
jgi:hypothetical protein